MYFGSKYVYTKTDVQRQQEPDDDRLSEEEVVVREDDDAVLSCSSGESDDEETCVLDIFDTAGQEEYSALREQYVRTADGFVVVFSVTDGDSFHEAESIFTWLKRFQTDFHAVLCGNKTDLTDERKVTKEDAQKLADGLGVPYFETSAKTGDNVTEVYHGLIRTIPRHGVDYKVVMLGTGGVGKSSVTMRFTQNHFLEDYDPTIEDSFRKMIQVSGQTKGDKKSRKSKLKKAMAALKSGGSHQKKRGGRRRAPQDPPRKKVRWLQQQGQAMQSRPLSGAALQSNVAPQQAPPMPQAAGGDEGGRGIFASLRQVFSGRSRGTPPPPLQLPQQQQQQQQMPIQQQQQMPIQQQQQMPFQQQMQSAGFDSDDSASSEEEEEKPKATRTTRQRKTDGNVVLLPLGKLAEDPNLITGDPVRCGQCEAVLSSTSVLTPQDDGKKMWKCEFCGHENCNLDVEDEEIPQGECFDFMLEPATAVEGEGAAEAGGSDEAKKKGGTGYTIYCMDISSSMGMNCAVPEFQAAWRVERTRGQSSVSSVSRLQCIKEAVQRQLEQMNTDHPDKPVMLAVFGSEMDVKGGGDFIQAQNAKYAGLDSMSYDALITKGKELAGNYRLNPLTDSFVNLDAAVKGLHTSGCTALGPALAICAGFISEVPSSEIILCTDGMPNVGVGSLQSGRNDPAFYTQIGEYAKSNKTVINILAVEGEPVGLPQVKVAAEVSGGIVNVLNPLEIVRQLRQIMQNSMVASCVTVTFFLHPDFVFDEPGYPSDTSRLSKELGNVLKDDDLTFRFKPKDPNKPLTMEQVPFQVQLTYTRPDGMKCLRIMSKSNQATSNRQDMEEGINVSVLGAAAVKRTAALAKKHDVKAANVHLKAVKRLAKRGAKSSDQKEELFAFRDECQDLDQEITDNLAKWNSASASQMEARSNMLFAKSKGGHARYQNAMSKQALAEARFMSKGAKAQYYGRKF